MNLQDITYDNKAAMNENASIPAINKVQASDMNQIKEAINNNNSEIKNKSAISIALVGNPFSYTGNREQKLTLNTATNIKGSNLSITNDGGVLIGSNIKTVLVSGQVYYFTGSNHTSGKDAIVKRNNDTVMSSNSLVNSNYLKVLAGTTIVNVQEGDIIYLYSKNGSTGNCQIGAGDSNTYLTVMEI